jgi:hypothetical protein
MCTTVFDDLSCRRHYHIDDTGKDSGGQLYGILSLQRRWQMPVEGTSVGFLVFFHRNEEDACRHPKL